jgi:two-component system capsular synthesis sensor histidine kinase RcsC
MRVLVIDDEAGIRAIFCEFLDILGHEADVAARGDEGLALFDPHRYDLVLTDLVMPGMNGLEVAHAIRARCPWIPVIVTSGSAADDDLRHIEAAGLCFLQKPVGINELSDAMRAPTLAPADPIATK